MKSVTSKQRKPKRAVMPTSPPPFVATAPAPVVLADRKPAGWADLLARRLNPVPTTPQGSPHSTESSDSESESRLQWDAWAATIGLAAKNWLFEGVDMAIRCRLQAEGEWHPAQLRLLLSPLLVSREVVDQLLLGIRIYLGNLGLAGVPVSCKFAEAAPGLARGEPAGAILLCSSRKG